MTRLTHPLPVKATVASHFIERCATRFSPEEIRQAIAELVAHNQLDMASALCAAGLSLYPNSQDILCISALLAELEQDWSSAQCHRLAPLDSGCAVPVGHPPVSGKGSASRFIAPL